MLTISVIINANRDMNTGDVAWPENSFPLYYNGTMDGRMNCFPFSRIVPCATLEQITFMKLSGFVVFESNRHTIETSDGKFVMRDIRPNNAILTNAV